MAPIEYVNMSKNSASDYCTTLNVWQVFRISIHFHGKAPTNCLAFGIRILNYDFACLSLRNNNARLSGTYVELVVVRSILVIVESVFQANSFDHFVGTSIDRSGH
jgi:hypothetical protein